MTLADDMKVTALASWYGSNRMLGPIVGEAFARCPWVGVVFAGGMAEVPHIKARSLFINDLHPHAINMYRIAANPVLGPEFYRSLRRVPFCSAVLAEAQQRCAKHEVALTSGRDVSWAVDYFICAWMSRHGSAGDAREFKAPISLRYNANGGDSATHYWNAVASIAAWRRILRRANFTCSDFRDFLGKCKDDCESGIYCDPPFPGPGDKYKFTFTPKDHRDLAERLSAYASARVVCRFYEHEFVRELYPASRWHYRELVGRKQTNGAAAELLISNQPWSAREVA